MMLFGWLALRQVHTQFYVSESGKTLMAVEAMAIIDEATCVAPTLGVPLLKARSTLE